MSWTQGLLLLASGYAGVMLLLIAVSERQLPEWLFPVRGRWLRYYLAGFGVLLGLPFLLPVALGLSPLFAVFGFCELVSRWSGHRSRQSTRSGEPGRRGHGIPTGAVKLPGRRVSSRPR